MASATDDPVITSYDVFLTESEITRYVLQYLDRPTGHAYDERYGQKPTAFRLKPRTGLVEVDVPINTRVNYDVNKGLRYGDALKKSRMSRDGGAYGMAGGFSTGGSGGGAAARAVKMEDVEMGGTNVDMMDIDGRKTDSASLLRVQTLGGSVKIPEEGDPVYMLAASRGKNLYLSPISAVVQLHPQLHHLDALEEIPKARGGKVKKDTDEERPAETEARAIDIKIKATEDEEMLIPSNLELLKKMQEEKWQSFEWIDAEAVESWQRYESHMMHQYPDALPQLQSAITSEDYLDGMSAPRIDPARPELTGWAMKQNRKKQKEDAEDDDSDTADR